MTSTFRERAASIGAPLYEAGQSWRSFAQGEGFRFESPSRTADLPLPALPGAHQIINAGVALACLDHLAGAAISDEAIAKGLAEVRWPGRLQRLTRGPLVDRLPPAWELWLDGGHNDSAGEVLGAQAARWRGTDGLPLKLIFGMLATKEPKDFLRPLSGFASSLRAVAIPGEEASLTPDDRGISRSGSRDTGCGSRGERRRGAGCPDPARSAPDSRNDLRLPLSRGSACCPGMDDAAGPWLELDAGYSTDSTHWNSAPLGSAPILVAATLPSLNSIRVGMPRTPN